MFRDTLRMIPAAVLAVLAGAFAAGCASPAEPSAVAVTSLSESVESESDVRSETTFVIRDAETLRRVWQQVYRGRREVPVVDFRTQMVVIVVLGERPTAGFTVQITGVSRSDRGLVVHLAATSPGTGCATAAALTYPVAVSRLRAFDGAVQFDFTRRTRDCTGR